MRMVGRLSRRIRGYGKAKGIPVHIIHPGNASMNSRKNTWQRPKSRKACF